MLFHPCPNSSVFFLLLKVFGFSVVAKFCCLKRAVDGRWFLVCFVVLELIALDGRFNLRCPEKGFDERLHVSSVITAAGCVSCVFAALIRLT